MPKFRQLISTTSLHIGAALAFIANVDALQHSIQKGDTKNHITQAKKLMSEARESLEIIEDATIKKEVGKYILEAEKSLDLSDNNDPTIASKLLDGANNSIKKISDLINSGSDSKSEFINYDTLYSMMDNTNFIISSSQELEILKS